MPSDYDAIPAMNWSRLKLLKTSPALFAHRLTVERKDTDALRLGRAIHCAILEPDRWKSDFLVEPKHDRRTKEGKAARALWLTSHAGDGYRSLPAFDLRRKEGKAARDMLLAGIPEGVTVIAGDEPTASIIEGRELVSADDHALAERCAEAVRAHPKAMELLSFGRSEETIVWKDAETGLDCKGRLDLGKPGYILDLKSSRQTTLRAMAADFARLLYHGQLAFYQDGAIANRIIPRDAPTPRVIVVQTVEPFDVVPGFLGEYDLATGRRLYRSLLRRYLECQAAEWWPGLAPELVEMPLPDWAPGSVSEVHENDW